MSVARFKNLFETPGLQCSLVTDIGGKYLFFRDDGQWSSAPSGQAHAHQSDRFRASVGILTEICIS